MNETIPAPPSEMDIFRSLVDPEEPFLSPEAARGIMRLDFSAADRQRMNELAARTQPRGSSESISFEHPIDFCF